MYNALILRVRIVYETGYGVGKVYVHSQKLQKAFLFRNRALFPILKKIGLHLGIGSSSRSAECTGVHDSDGNGSVPWHTCYLDRYTSPTCCIFIAGRVYGRLRGDLERNTTRGRRHSHHGRVWPSLNPVVDRSYNRVALSILYIWPY